MKYMVENYIKINGTLHSRGEIIPGEILSDTKRDWLLSNKSISCIDDGEEIMPVPEVVQDEEDAPEIDIMAGLVREPEVKTPVKPKTGGRGKKK